MSDELAEGFDIVFLDVACGNGLVMESSNACLFQPLFDLGEVGLRFFFAVGAVADDGFDAQLRDLFRIGFGQLRRNIEVFVKFQNGHFVSLLCGCFSDGILCAMPSESLTEQPVVQQVPVCDM